VELAQIPVPEVLGDEDFSRLSAALSPLIADHGGGEAGVRGAAASIAEDLDRLAQLEREVRSTVDEATTSAKEIVDITLPPYWPWLLAASIAMALSGFFVMDAPQWRLPYIVGVGLALIAMGVHYFWRLYRRSQVIGPLQDRFDEREDAARELFGEIAALENSLEADGFALTTESFLPFAAPVRALATEGAKGDEARRRLTNFVTSDETRQADSPPKAPGSG
jgi:hypothetical protein